MDCTMEIRMLCATHEVIAYVLKLREIEGIRAQTLF